MSSEPIDARQKNWFPDKQVVIHDTIVVHDTVAVDYGIIQKKGLDSMIKPYLIQYYKAGWIDALNSAIDLYNKENFNAHDVYSERDKYWRKMENQVNSK